MTLHRKRTSEILPGVYRIILPLAGEKPGPMNVYLFTGRPVTIVDTGTLKSVPVLTRELAGLGMTFADIEQIVLTHGHIDHYGGAASIVRGAGRPVEVLAHEEDMNLIEYGIEVPKRRFAQYYRLMGVPYVHQVSLLAVRWIFKSMAERCDVTRYVGEGELLDLGGYEARVIATPGHTRGSISLYLEEERIVFPGDHILGHITPNAFVMLEADFSLPRRMSQVEFYESLAKIERLGPRMAYPAHGEPIKDVPGVIAMFREQFRLRQNNILAILASGGRTAYEIGRLLFPEIRGRRLPLEIFLMVSEVYTHLQVLEKEGRVVSRQRGAALRFALA